MAWDRRQHEELIVNLIRSLGTSLKNRGLYPVTHPLVRTPLEKAFKEIRIFFADRAELALAISDGTLVFEGFPIFSQTTSVEDFVQRLIRIGASAVIFERGMTIEDLEYFILFLHETKEDGLQPDEIQGMLVGAGAMHIRIKPMEKDEPDDFTLAREIHDDAVNVVSKVMRDVREGLIPSGVETERVARNISAMIARNPDAMIALTLIKNFDEYTYTHSVNVAVFSLSLAEALKLPQHDKIKVGVAGLLHDIGKTQLALNLIRKPGTLTVEEFEEIKKHPYEGFVLLEKMSHIPAQASLLVLEHHMRFDRTGYPRLESGYEMHKHSGIISIADTYDALTTMRSYQKARNPNQALEIIGKITGKSLDPELVTLFIKSMGAYPVGTVVRLSTMEIGQVVARGENEDCVTKVKLLTDRNGIPLARPESVELSDSVAMSHGNQRTIIGMVNQDLYSE